MRFSGCDDLGHKVARKENERRKEKHWKESAKRGLMFCISWQPPAGGWQLHETPLTLFMVAFLSQCLGEIPLNAIQAPLKHIDPGHLNISDCSSLIVMDKGRSSWIEALQVDHCHLDGWRNHAFRANSKAFPQLHMVGESGTGESKETGPTKVKTNFMFKPKLHQDGNKRVYIVNEMSHLPCTTVHILVALEALVYINPAKANHKYLILPNAFRTIKLCLLLVP
jgi:hypothetical protein